MSTPSPFVSISNQQIYDKLVSVEARVTELTPLAQTVAVDHERLRSLELQFVGLEERYRAAATMAARHKVAAWSALAAGVGGVVTAVVPLVVK